MPSYNSAKVSYAPKSSKVPVISSVETNDCALKIRWELPLYYNYLGGFITVASTDSASELINVNLTAEELYDECALIDGLKNGTRYAITISTLVAFEADDGDDQLVEYEGQEGILLTSAVAVGRPVGTPAAPTLVAEVDENDDTKAKVTVTLGGSNGDDIDTVLINMVDTTETNNPILTSQNIRLSAAQQKSGIVKTDFDVTPSCSYVFGANVSNVAGASESSKPCSMYVKARDEPTISLESIENGLVDEEGGNYSKAKVRATVPKRSGKVAHFRVYFANTLTAVNYNLGSLTYLDYTTIGAVPTKKDSDLYELTLSQFAGYDDSIAAVAIVAVSDKATDSSPIKFAVFFGQPANPLLSAAIMPPAKDNKLVASLHQIFKSASDDYDKLMLALSSIDSIDPDAPVKPATERLLESKIGAKLAEAIPAVYEIIKSLAPALGSDFVDNLGDEASFGFDEITSNTTYQELWDSKPLFYLARVLVAIFKRLRSSKFPVDKSLVLATFGPEKGTALYNRAMAMKLTIKDDQSKSDIMTGALVTNAAAVAEWVSGFVGGDSVTCTLEQSMTVTDLKADVDMFNAQNATALTSKAAAASLAELGVEFSAGKDEAVATLADPNLPIKNLSVIPLEGSAASLKWDVDTLSAKHKVYTIKVYKPKLGSNLASKLGSTLELFTEVSTDGNNAIGDADSTSVQLQFAGSAATLPNKGTVVFIDAPAPEGELVFGVIAHDGMTASDEVRSEPVDLADGAALPVINLRATKITIEEITLAFDVTPYPNLSKTNYTQFNVLETINEKTTIVATLDYVANDEKTITFNHTHPFGYKATYNVESVACYSPKDDSEDIEYTSKLVPVSLVIADKPSISQIKQVKQTLSVSLTSNGDTEPKLFAVLFDKDAKPLVLQSSDFTLVQGKTGMTATANLGDFAPFTSESDIAALVVAHNVAGQVDSQTAAWDALFA